jgi:hypothetical protein
MNFALLSVFMQTPQLLHFQLPIEILFNIIAMKVRNSEFWPRWPITMAWGSPWSRKHGNTLSIDGSKTTTTVPTTTAQSKRILSMVTNASIIKLLRKNSSKNKCRKLQSPFLSR